MKPILFNTEMVRAILANRKTVTRRLVKPQPKGHAALLSINLLPETVEAGTGAIYAFEDGTVTSSPYHPDDILYVRETWNYGYFDTTDFELKNNETFFEELKPGSMKDSFLFPRYFYRTEDLDGIVGVKWRPSIHMPREAARIFLRVTDVRVERLQAITPEQIDAEGYKEYAYSAKTGELLSSEPSWFKIAWDNTIKPADRALYGWNANPWVWVIEFERINREAAE